MTQTDTENQMSLTEQAQIYAEANHERCGQLYDNYLPYAFHLRLAANVAQQFIGLIDPLERETVIAAVFLHDVLEDCNGVSYNDLKVKFGSQVADIVYAVTNEKGKTRKERANDKYYQGIKDTQFAVFVKLSDRIANVTYGRYISPNKGMYQVYQRENDNFVERLTGSQTIQLVPMIAHLRNLLR